MAPVIKTFEKRALSGINSIVVSTGQHRELMQPILNFFRIKPAIDLGLMQKNCSLNSLFSRAVAELDGVFAEINPDIVLVHGDTTSAAAATTAAFHRRIKVGHVEAGLRTGNIDQPFPEEFNRKLIALGSEVHFAPTRAAKSRLIAEGIAPSNIIITGNTIVDALLSVTRRLRTDAKLRRKLDQKFAFLGASSDIILVTGHRRENFGDAIQRICKALIRISDRPSISIIYPVHLNPNVLRPVNELLGGRENIHLIPPADYVEFVYLMMRSSVILTDSGGVQEEAPSLGKPVLVMREVTERPEAIAAGTARLVGTDPDKIIAALSAELGKKRYFSADHTVRTPFGDGRAAERIVDYLIARMARRRGDSQEAIREELLLSTDRGRTRVPQEVEIGVGA